MTQEEKLIYLIRALLNEDERYGDMELPELEQDRKNLLRALMNVRMPKKISRQFLEVQDSYLQEESRRNGITDINELTPVPLDPCIYLWQGDITTLRCDAIVNAANAQMLGCFQPLHGCIDNIIHTKAGIQLRLACHRLMIEQRCEEPTGEAKITSAYNLPCKYVLHTVGPIVQGPLREEHERLLASCYRSCLELAQLSGVRHIAFCCISTGVFMFPNERAAEIAVYTVNTWLNETGSNMKVIFNVFKDIDLMLYKYCLCETEADTE